MAHNSALATRPSVCDDLSNTTLRSLQIGRGIAALLVVLFHLNNSIWSDAKYFPHPFSPLLSFGNSGVQFFFVLSGFIIYLVHARDIGAPDRLKNFAIKRFARIYPTYWLALAAFIAMLYAEPFWGTADERSVGNFITSALLLPAPVAPILGVAWTLKHEVMFYAVFAVAIVNAGVGLALFAVWQVLCLAHALTGSTAFPGDMVFSANNLLFSFGLISAHLFKRQRCPAAGTVALSGAALFIATGLHQVFATEPLAPNAYVLAFGAASAAAILGACSYERTFGIRAPRLFAVIGDASYSIYLVHLPLLSIFAKLLFASGLATLLPESMSLVLLVCATVACGIIVSKTIEMPLVAMFQKSRQIRTRPSGARPGVVVRQPETKS